jgi:hypothetical protein
MPTGRNVKIVRLNVMIRVRTLVSPLWFLLIICYEKKRGGKLNFAFNLMRFGKQNSWKKHMFILLSINLG